MSQTTLTSYFNSRKRPANDELGSSKAKIAHIERDTCKTSHKDEITKSSMTTSLAKEQPVHPTSTQLDVEPLNGLQSTSTFQKNSVAFSKKESSANIEKNKELSNAELINSARKDLSLGDIRKKLAGSSRLAELKATAARLSKGIQELKDSSNKRNLIQFKSINVDVPISPSKRFLLKNELLSPKKESEAEISQPKPIISPRKVVVSPVKSPNKVPAYIRHASLASTSPTLPLPHHYRFLAELFRGMETVVALLFNRNEKITFSKLKPSVQEMLKRNFTEKHLAQIKNLVPDFYNYEVQKLNNFSNSSRKELYELVISPNFPTDIKNMNPTVLLERRRYFFDTLLKLVKKHHSQYLASLDPPMDIPDDKLVRWHPAFELEKIPEVESAKLPEMPNVEKLTSAQDVLAKARELFKCNTKMERALEKLAEAKARTLIEKKDGTQLKNNTEDVAVQTSQASVSNVTILNPALRNLPASLLEKVKAKQAAKALMAMTQSSENEKNYLTYCRLPDLARTLRNIFVTERKNVLALNIILSKLENSFKSNVTSSDLQQDIKILSEVAPKWIQLHEIRNATYVKLDKNIDLKKIITILEHKAKTMKAE